MLGWDKFCETLVQQYDTKTLCIVLHDREFCLNYTIFNIIIGIKDGGLIDIHEEVCDITELRNESRTDRRGISITIVSDTLIASESYDDDFKTVFSLFLLGIVLCSTNVTYINLMYLHALKDKYNQSRKRIGLHGVLTFCEKELNYTVF